MNLSQRMILAAITSLLFTLLLGPKCIRILYGLKTGRSIRVEDCPPLALLHEKKRETPTMGGILILGAMLLSLFLWMDLSHTFTFILLITTLWLGFVGGLDDFLKMKRKNARGLSAKKKFFSQLILGGCIASYLFIPSVSETLHEKGFFSPPVIKEQVHHKVETLSLKEYSSTYYLPFLKSPLFTLQGLGIGLGVCIVLFVLTGSSNAVNLADGLDGLAAGLVVMVASVLALFAFFSNHFDLARYFHLPYVEGSGEIAIYLSALIGACLGFLWYNGHPAQLFMGDIGSLALGGILGLSAILLRREGVLALAGGVLVMETLSVIMQVASFRWRGGKRIFRCAPLHHHFEYKGWPETKVVLRFWIVGLFLAFLSMASLKFQ